MARICHYDWETRSKLDLPIVGTTRYALDPSTVPLILSWGVNDDPIKLWVDDLSGVLHPAVWAYILTRVYCHGRGAPRVLPDGTRYGSPAEIHEVAADPEGYFDAWNSIFDRTIWQQIAAPEFGFPMIAIEQTVDSMAQAQASSLPGALDFAGRALGLGQKTLGGKAIMKKFADANHPLPGDETVCLTDSDVKSAIDAWCLYLDYGVQDTELMRDVWNCTRPLTVDEWRCYWASERINDRGMMVDVDVCRGAAAYREEEAEFVASECARITDGVITAPTLTKQINEWVFDRLPDDLAETMVKQRDEEGYVTRLTGAKDVMGRLLEDIKVSDTPPGDEVIDLIELLQFGRASSAVKFEKMLAQEVDSRIYGQFVFNGARHRFSSRGIQLHNLPRAFYENEQDLLDMVAAQVPIEELRKVAPVAAVLAKLIRPTIIAPPGKKLIWADYSAVEARVNPWLAGTREADQAVLEPFRQMDSDKTKSVPDIYVLNAEPVFKIYADVLWERYKNGDPEAKAARQAGKVLTLSLGFLGGVGALKAMARGYNIRLTDEEAKVWVDGYRDRNRWVRRFGDKVNEAMFSAMRSPMTGFKAGRVEYVFVPGLMGGTLVAWLPDGRPITYPMAKIEQREKFGNMQDTITYIDGMSRMSMWSGLAVENLTQFTAAGLLRESIVRIEDEGIGGDIIGHTHDELLLECDEDKAPEVVNRLVTKMTTGFDWADGLPLAAEPAASFYYSKNEKLTAVH